MADQENIKRRTTKELLDAQDEASMALGQAWGLAETLCFHVGESGGFDPEGVMRVVFELVHKARDMADEGSIQWLQMSATLAVCDLVLVDRAECDNDPNSPSTWALGAVPTALKTAKAFVDAEPWHLSMANAD